MPKIYCRPKSTPAAANYCTMYQVFVGPGTPFEGPPGLTLDMIDKGNGLDRTLLVVEAQDVVPWTKPADLAYAPDQPLPRLGGLFSDKFRPFSEEYWQSRVRSHGLFADNSCRPISTKEEAAIRAMISWKGTGTRKPK